MTFLVRTSHNFYRTRFSVPFLWLVTLSQASLQRLGGGGERNRSRTKADDRYAKFLPTYDKRVIPEIIFNVETIVLLIKTINLFSYCNESRDENFGPNTNSTSDTREFSSVFQS